MYIYSNIMAEYFHSNILFYSKKKDKRTKNTLQAAIKKHFLAIRVTFSLKFFKAYVWYWSYSLLKIVFFNY